MLQLIARSRPWWRSNDWLAITVLTLGACDSDPTEPLVPSALVEVSGNGQELATGGMAASEPLVVRVLDQYASPLGGVLVEWSISDGDGAISAESTSSDVDGEAQVLYASGTLEGQTVITAEVSGLDPVTFLLTVSAQP